MINMILRKRASLDSSVAHLFVVPKIFPLCPLWFKYSSSRSGAAVAPNSISEIGAICR